MIYLMQTDRRTVTASIPADLMERADLREESLRLASFLYSATVRSGDKPSFKYVETTHQDMQ